jgi:flagellar basal body-associated protein FliL
MPSTSSSNTVNNVTYEETQELNNQNNNLKTPILIALIAAGVFVIAAIGVGAFFILKKPKTKNTEE